MGWEGKEVWDGGWSEGGRVNKWRAVRGEVGVEGGNAVFSPFMVTAVAMELLGPLPTEVAALSMMSYDTPPSRCTSV